mgnify:CR=1 FL=1
MGTIIESIDKYYFIYSFRKKNVDYTFKWISICTWKCFTKETTILLINSSYFCNSINTKDLPKQKEKSSFFLILTNWNRLYCKFIFTTTTIRSIENTKRTRHRKNCIVNIFDIIQITPTTSSTNKTKPTMIIKMKAYKFYTWEILPMIFPGGDSTVISWLQQSLSANQGYPEHILNGRWILRISFRTIQNSIF